MVRERKISPAKQFRAVSLNRGKVVWVKIEAKDEKHLPMKDAFCFQLWQVLSEQHKVHSSMCNETQTQFYFDFIYWCQNISKKYLWQDNVLNIVAKYVSPLDERRGVTNNFRAYDGTAPALTTARFQNKVSNSCSHTHKCDVIRLCIKRA